MASFLDNVEKNVIGKMYGGEVKNCPVSSPPEVRTVTAVPSRHVAAYEMPVSGDLGAKWEQLASEHKTTTLRR